MKIIAGSARGLPLRVPADATRPTSDRVREAIFSILGARVAGARVLDLFAGSGAMGIEALSRGATEAVLIDSDRKACECIAANLAKARLADRAGVRCVDAFTFLRGSAADGGFDLVFADPPYRKLPDDRDFAAEVAAFPDWGALIRPDGILVLETGKSGANDGGLFWEVRDKRIYGDTVVSFLVPAES